MRLTFFITSFGGIPLRGARILRPLTRPRNTFFRVPVRSDSPTAPHASLIAAPVPLLQRMFGLLQRVLRSYTVCCLIAEPISFIAVRVTT